MPKSVEQSPFERAAQDGLVGEQRVTNAARNYNSSTQNPVGSPPAEQQLTWIGPFLDALTDGASINAAARAAGVHPTLVYKRRREDEAFRRAWHAAANLSTPLLEQEAQRRAFHGVDKPIYQKGELVGYERRYSDTLLIFLLKGRRPDKYRDGHDDGARNVQININVETVDKLPPHVLEMARAQGQLDLTPSSDGICGESATPECPAALISTEAVEPIGRGAEPSGAIPQEGGAVAQESAARLEEVQLVDLADVPSTTVGPPTDAPSALDICTLEAPDADSPQAD